MTAPTPIRVRFAPSPTGALHIGGVRTALYNYLFAKQHGGTFILRLEDTDRTRFVPGAEAYIKDALEWLGILPDEGPGIGGEHGPYRQSERKELYQKYADQLLASGHAYHAFDTPAELELKREEAKAAGQHAWKYDHQARMHTRNSLSLPETEVKKLLESDTPRVIRLKVPESEQIQFQDIVRGTVTFSGEELDDKVLIKTDGMPTYHMANIVDDHLMEVSHVIRGEEWLSSTAHHMLLYRALGWSPPVFAHLPLILKPSGKGKLSKRDGRKLGIPVFPIAWEAEQEADSFLGFREFGFVPRAVNNFLAFLGWNPGTEQELFGMDELIAAFSLDKIGKSGARFDYDKARWFNQQYILQADPPQLAEWVTPWLAREGVQAKPDRVEAFCVLMQERATLLPDFWEGGAFLWQPVETYDEKPIRKRWKPESGDMLTGLADQLSGLDDFGPEPVHEAIQAFMQSRDIKPGQLFPFLRLALSGTLKGPGISDMAAFLGKEETLLRVRQAADRFPEIAKSNAHG